MGKRADCGNAFHGAAGRSLRDVQRPGRADPCAACSPAEYKEIDRAKILDPAGFARGRDVVWSHPAFAQRSVFARNDKEMVRVSLAAEEAAEKSTKQAS